eukprot:2901767-Rhodomonas_salina.1
MGYKPVDAPTSHQKHVADRCCSSSFPMDECGAHLQLRTRTRKKIITFCRTGFYHHGTVEDSHHIQGNLETPKAPPAAAAPGSWTQWRCLACPLSKLGSTSGVRDCTKQAPQRRQAAGLKQSRNRGVPSPGSVPGTCECPRPIQAPGQVADEAKSGCGFMGAKPGRGSIEFISITTRVPGCYQKAIPKKGRRYCCCCKISGTGNVARISTTDQTVRSCRVPGYPGYVPPGTRGTLASS